MGVLRTQFTWIIFIAKNKQTRDRDKDRFYVQFYWLRATTINIGFTNQDPSCRAGSHKSSSVFLTILLHYPEPGREWWSLQRAVSTLIQLSRRIMSAAEARDETLWPIMSTNQIKMRNESIQQMLMSDECHFIDRTNTWSKTICSLVKVLMWFWYSDSGRDTFNNQMEDRDQDQG